MFIQNGAFYGFLSLGYTLLKLKITGSSCRSLLLIGQLLEYWKLCFESNMSSREVMTNLTSDLVPEVQYSARPEL